MKPQIIIFYVLLSAFSAYAQTDNDRAKWVASILEESKPSNSAETRRILRFDFGPLWTRVHDNDSVLGYIGDNYQRLRIVILSATKNPSQPDTYTVTGKSMVKNVIRGFSGTMKITDARVSKNTPDGIDEEYKGKVKKHGVVVGEYHFSENRKQTNTGSFDGVFATHWYVDRRGRLKYDEIEVGADGWTNNQFAGTWTSYRGNAKKPASWGDSRIPISGDLDIGAGEFSPDEQYVQNGWQGYRDAYTNQDKRALAAERRQWWK
jgi:hypothetical protein